MHFDNNKEEKNKREINEQWVCVQVKTQWHKHLMCEK